MKKELKSRSLVRMSTSILKESRETETFEVAANAQEKEEDKKLECPKKKEKKKKRAKFEEKHGRKSLPTSPLLPKSDRVSWEIL